MPRIECVVVCCNYSDFLAWTLPFNKHHFDRMVIVTSPEDVATQRVCEHNYVECVVTDVMFENKAPFNKGKAINAALKKLDFQGWCVHMDADIVLPPRTRDILNLLPLQEDKLYSADRFMVASFEEWANFFLNIKPQHTNWRVYPDAFPLGYRLMFPTPRWKGWVPAGYFQLFHRLSPQFDKEPWYPENSDTAADSDILFAEKWTRQNRVLIPEVFVYHLDSTGKDKVIGANWEGRKTPLFSPASLNQVN